ncbi:DEAD/DEAH box helicase [Alicyclobacillus tolerans]|uniref:DEAD/DEAH box helicase n=1 Tax=Alicyclobacillus tolerans TaxID=90970 RepID=UPI001F30AF2F|nr:DEAD/DEAH box helicase [Alicyclobacillus tolerans]MCF8567044.1 DEAD/DEAH box helicase [Alicyclobacillus tolerans]
MRNEPLITKSEIRELCGTTYYSRGRRYFEQGRVTSLNRDPDFLSTWTAKVRGNRVYTVKVTLDEDDLDADCTCPIFNEDDLCKHVAAVLFAIAEQTTPTHPLSKSRLASVLAHAVPTPSNALSPASTTHSVQRTPNDSTSRLIQFFREAQTATLDMSGIDNREWLQVEFICTPHVSAYRSRDYIGLEMKVGPKHTYVVKKIRGFLQVIEQRRQHTFTPKFTYDPNLHRFRPADLDIIEMLQQIMREEDLYSNIVSSYSSYVSSRDDRTLLISPAMWKLLYPLLLESTTVVNHAGQTGALQIVNHVPSITAHLTTRKKGGYSLQVDGLKEMDVLPNYRCVLYGVTFHVLDSHDLEQIIGMKRIMENEGMAEIPISTDALPSVVNEVIPGLKRMGQITVDKKIANRIVETPLEAKLYLDGRLMRRSQTDKDVLTARLEFVYGDIAFDPLKPAPSSHPDAEQIIVRDRWQEENILQFLKQSGFEQQGPEWILQGEEPLYRFVLERLPKLREWMQVYATASVDAWVKPPIMRPHSRVEIDTKMNWLDISFDMGDLDEHEILRVLQSMIEKKKYHRLRDGAFLSLADEAFAQMGDFLEDLGIRASDLKNSSQQIADHRRRSSAHHDSEQVHRESGVGFRLPVFRALPLIESKHETSTVKLGKHLRGWLDNLRHPDNLEAEVPAGLTASLREYQKFGFQWMKTLSQYGFGGILADEMGLGKTIQAIAYLLSERVDHVREGTSNRVQLGTKHESTMEPPFHPPALIVCPSSLTFNWLNEIEKFAPELRAVVVTGDKIERQNILEASDSLDVMITSFPLLLRDVDVYQNQQFSALILDEAQIIKNHHTQTAQAVMAIRSSHRFALTGTPVENSLEDLWSIFHAIFPTLLGGLKSFSGLSSEAVAKRVRPFILRRLKRDVLRELPDKIEMLQSAELTTEQKKVYLAYLERVQQEAQQGLTVDGFQKGRFRILAGLTRLRQICCHPSLCIENYHGKSGKFERLMNMVDEYLSSNQRMLIFSQFTSMLDIIHHEMKKRNLRCFYLDGQTPAKERMELCQRFNEGDTPIFLISLKAGGTGLNLTGADTVILYDLWWNPAVEEQAADRAHRIGQKRTVQVVRMVTEGTIEEKMYQLQQRKRDLIDAVVQANDEGLQSLTEEDVRELLMI